LQPEAQTQDTKRR